MNKLDKMIAKMEERNKRPSTVGEIIEALKKLPKNRPVYIRSKYTGDVSWDEDHPIKAHQICRMESDKLGKHVNILY